MINKPSPLNSEYNRDPKTKALKRRYIGYVGFRVTVGLPKWVYIYIVNNESFPNILT